MPVVLGLFCALPLLLGIGLEYLCCRLPRRRKIWRALPAALEVAFALLAAAVRLNNWQSQAASPAAQLAIFPGLPVLFLLAGNYLGWRLWRWLWGPRVVGGR